MYILASKFIKILIKCHICERFSEVALHKKWSVIQLIFLGIHSKTFWLYAEANWI